MELETDGNVFILTCFQVIRGRKFYKYFQQFCVVSAFSPSIFRAYIRLKIRKSYEIIAR